MATTIGEVLRSCMASFSGVAAGFGDVRHSLAFDALYERNESFPVRLSDRARSLAGERVAMTGYLSPIVAGDGRACVLARLPGGAAARRVDVDGWTTDIVLVYLDRRPPVPLSVSKLPATVVGRLEVGLAGDPDFGWQSHLRLMDARIVTP